MSRHAPPCKKNIWTRCLIVDSQAVKNTCNASKDSKGFCRYKATNGIKRHLAVDSLGFPFMVHCTKANVSDDQGLIEMLLKHQTFLENIPEGEQVTLLLDNGYHVNFIMNVLRQSIPHLIDKIRLEYAPKIAKKKKQNGFTPVATRWIVERSFAWLERAKSLVKNFERTLQHAESKIIVCFIRLILKRLAI